MHGLLMEMCFVSWPLALADATDRDMVRNLWSALSAKSNCCHKRQQIKP